MAKLKCKNHKLLFEFVLYPDPDSYDWITYSIKISAIDEENKELLALSSSEEYTLYFEACYEKEVPAICDGILKVVSGEEKRFFFEPIDEKDFQLDVKTINEELYLHISSEDFIILGNYQWNNKSYLGIKTQVKKEDLLEFVKQLRSEYEQIESKFPGKTFLPKDKKMRK